MELDKLNTVADLARSREREAASELHQGRQHLAHTHSQLTQLEAFKLEYEERLSGLAQSGMAARQLQDYRRFLANLNAAIDRQGVQVSDAQQSVSEKREKFMDRSVHRESLDLLMARGQRLLLQASERREQRELDERNAHAHHQRD